MTDRRYYSIRTGKHPAGERLDLAMLLKLFFTLYSDFERRYYFQQAFGYNCVDVGDVDGTIGHDIEGYILLRLRKDNLWPIQIKYQEYSEEDLFDVIEFLYDHVSKPISGDYHSWGNCGWHYHMFDQQSGQTEFMIAVNKLLKDYGDYELSPKGEILTIVVRGTEILFTEKAPEYDRENVNDRIEEAVHLFRSYRSSLEDKKTAVRSLVDVLEFLRPKLKVVLTRADESDLFNMANNFGIRHHDQKQKTDYDKQIWLDWMFYYYLATINATLRLISRGEKTA